MEKEKFNYQIVLKVNDDMRIIFAGVTDNSVSDLLLNCYKVLDSANTSEVSETFFAYPIENFVYQPVKTIEDGSKK